MYWRWSPGWCWSNYSYLVSKVEKHISPISDVAGGFCDVKIPTGFTAGLLRTRAVAKERWQALDLPLWDVSHLLHARSSRVLKLHAKHAQAVFISTVTTLCKRSHQYLLGCNLPGRISCGADSQGVLQMEVVAQAPSFCLLPQSGNWRWNLRISRKTKTKKKTTKPQTPPLRTARARFKRNLVYRCGCMKGNTKAVALLIVLFFMGMCAQG